MTKACEECNDLGCEITEQRDLKGLSDSIFKLRYAINDRETWSQCTDRVARAISSIEPNGKRNYYYTAYREMINNFLFIPGGRILRNAGKNKGMLLNCFGLAWEDDIRSIKQLDYDACVISKYGGGVGFDASPLRPEGAPLISQGNNSESSGVISFIDGINYWLGLIKGGGDRRGAGITFLITHHPQIFEFIEKKKTDDIWRNFNVSIKLRKDFLNAVKKDKDWNLHFNNKIYRTVKAREIWDSAVNHAWSKGDPGFINFDNIDDYNPLYYCEKIATVNPCVTGDTLVSTTMGDLPIKDLTKYKFVDVYTRQKNGMLAIRPARFFRTKLNAKVITVETSRGKIRCTPDHEFITRDGKIKAINLKPNQKLIGLLRKKGNERSIKVGCTDGGYEHEARFVSSYYFGMKGLSYDVHHIDGDQANNSITNLQLLPHYMHSVISNNGHDKWCSVDSKGRFVKKDKRKKRKHIDFNGNNRTWKVISVVDNGELEHVFDGNVDDTHCYFANGILISNCGEIPLPAYGACCLGSVNLSEMYNEKNNDINWKFLKSTVYSAVRFLDNVLDVTEYPLSEIDLVARSTRRIGLGVMGLHHLMLKMGINEYGSKDSIEFMEGLLTKFRNYAYEASIELAKERGPFQKFQADAHVEGLFVKTLPRRIRKDIAEFGLRNGTLLSMQPTGTTSIVANNTSQGMQSIFHPIYKRTYYEGGKKKQVTEMDSLFKEYVLNGKDISNFIGSYEIPPEKYLEMQGTAQQYIDNSISLTVPIKNDYPVEKLNKLLLDHMDDVKGVTIYREGSKGEEILVPCDYKLSKDKLLKLAEA